MGKGVLQEEIESRLKETKEQHEVVGPLIALLVSQGWLIEQIIFGKTEWRVPKVPSELTKREKGHKYSGFPVDIAVFDRVDTVGDPQHLLFVIECKQHNEEAGVTQLEGYFIGEPHVKLGIWTNNADPAAKGVFIYRKPNGGMLLKRRLISDIPKPGEAVEPESQIIKINDLISPTGSILRNVFQDLLDKVVIADSNVTCREEQLDQLCNLLLLKLESDKQGKANTETQLYFKQMDSPSRTAEVIRSKFNGFVELYPGTFTTDKDKKILFGDETINACVEALSGLRLIDLGVSTVSVAFQILRSEALKQGEGQYFTPYQVIQAGVRLLDIQWDDIIIDPCGTGGFLVETMLEIKRKNKQITDGDLSRWVQTHVFGIEKDAIGLKLTKAIMQIVGDGSAHCVRGDSVRIHKWARDFPHLSNGTYRNGRFTVVVTNPPFGQNLKVSAVDSRLSGLDIATKGETNYYDLEIGLLFLQRAYQLLQLNGRVGIILPETYFFSNNYSFIFDWLKPRLRPVVIANIPMEAFQGFCRAKTNFYVFKKIG